jgi:integrase
MRAPDVKALAVHTPSPTLATVAEEWRSSRVDVADGTAATHKVNLSRIVPRLGARTLDTLEPTDVAALVAEWHEAGLKRESIRKTIATLAMIFGYAKVVPNPARDRTTIKLPREDKMELNPPTAEQVLAVHRLLAPAYRLPLLVLDATGMRVGELEALTWGDVDEPRRRWRVSQAVAKIGRARWAHVPAPAGSARHRLGSRARGASAARCRIARARMSARDASLRRSRPSSRLPRPRRWRRARSRRRP